MSKKSGMLLRVAVLLAAVLSVIVYAGSVRAQEQKVVSGTLFAMDTFIEQKWYGPNAQKTYDEVAALIREIESQISQHIAESELGRLNSMAAGVPVELSERTFELLKRSKELSEASQGAFDITIAPLVNGWGITGLDPQVPTPQKVQDLLSLGGLQELELDEANHTAHLPREGMAVDLGGIAKGWTADRIREVALQNGITHGYVSLGGNLMVIGAKPDGAPFKFGVRDPRGDATSYIGIVTLEGKTMATTGDYERFFEQDGVRYHHVLDPRTGYPAQGGLISVSVICEDGALADYLSTTLFVLGKERALDALDDSRFGLILVDSDKNVYVSKGLMDDFVLHEGVPGYRFIR